MSENCDTSSVYSYNQGNISTTIFAMAPLPALIVSTEGMSNQIPKPLLSNLCFSVHRKHQTRGGNKATNVFHHNHNKTLTRNNGAVYKI